MSQLYPATPIHARGIISICHGCERRLREAPLGFQRGWVTARSLRGAQTPEVNPQSGFSALSNKTGLLQNLFGFKTAPPLAKAQAETPEKNRGREPRAFFNLW
jgi:hypothetical protein